MLKIPYDVSPKYALLKNQVFEEFSHFFVAIFSLVFIGHLYQHLFLSSFILNHTSRLSSCKILLFLGCILKFPTWQDFSNFSFLLLLLLLLFFGPNFCLDRPFGFSAQRTFFFFFFFFFLALTFAQIALLGFQLSGLFFFFCGLSSLD